MRSFDRRELNHLAVDHELPLVRDLAEFAYSLLCDADQVIKEDLPAVGNTVKVIVRDELYKFASSVRALLNDIAEGRISLHQAYDMVGDIRDDHIDSAHRRIDSAFESVFGVEVR